MMAKVGKVKYAIIESYLHRAAERGRTSCPPSLLVGWWEFPREKIL